VQGLQQFPQFGSGLFTTASPGFRYQIACNTLLARLVPVRKKGQREVDAHLRPRARYPPVMVSRALTDPAHLPITYL